MGPIHQSSRNFDGCLDGMVGGLLFFLLLLLLSLLFPSPWNRRVRHFKADKKSEFILVVSFNQNGFA